VEFPLAHAIASHLQVVARTGSTNADLRAQAESAEDRPHLSTLITRDQTAGRGRLDRTWVAPSGTALAVSVLLRTIPVDPAARGWIPLAAGLAMSEAVAAQLPGRDVAVKWPNDVLVEDRKICGILAEATRDAVVVGAGVNTTMTVEQLPVPTATSFAALGVDVDEDRLLASYLETLDDRLSALIAAGDAVSSGLHAAVTARCTTLGRPVRVSMPAGRILEGVATAIDAEGRLLVESDGAEHAISAGDVVHVRAAGS
jgi:BirA family biotin operon repressor/biotin-[acetyl-CoA-carboxylase] ligase